eukprot:2814631-Rhodomonas_salina.1
MEPKVAAAHEGCASTPGYPGTRVDLPGYPGTRHDKKQDSKIRLQPQSTLDAAWSDSDAASSHLFKFSCSACDPPGYPGRNS